MITKQSIDIAEAGRVVAACSEAARERGVAVSIAVVDEGGVLLQFVRLAGARGFTVDLASRKAPVAAAIGVPTAVLTEMSARSPGPASESAVGAGGQPIVARSMVVGAIGVSGATPDVDEAVAAAGIAALRDLIGQ
ncbi:MAG: heme-binding protein [Devosia sp.]